MFPLNEGRDVVDGAYVTTITTPTTLFEIVLDQWIHPYKMKLYNFDIALYIKLLTLVETTKMQYQFCGYVAILVFHTCSFQCYDFYMDILKGLLDRHIINSFEIKITSLETLNICSQTSD
jgi:hypothetical protein